MQYSNNILERYESRPRKWWLYTLIVFIMALLLSWSASSVTFKGFAAKGTEVAKGIFWGLVKPDMNLLFSTSTDGVPYLLMETVCIAILGTVVGGILALPISVSGQPEDHAQARRVHLQRADSAHPHAARPSSGR